VRLDRSQYCFEALGVAGNDVALFKEVVTAGEVAHKAACFLNQQGARGHVPFGQARLPECIKTTGGDVSQVQARSAGATDAGGLAYQARNMPR
jgi:hypothetical protein